MSLYCVEHHNILSLTICTISIIFQEVETVRVGHDLDLKEEGLRITN